MTSFYNPDYVGRYVFSYRDKPYAVTSRDIARFDDSIVPVVSFSELTNHVLAALIDAEENIWVGTWEGLQKFRKTGFQLYNIQTGMHKEVFSMLEKKNGDLLFGGNNGIVFTKENNQLVPSKTVPPLFKTAEVLCMYEAADGSLWSGSGYQGISRYQNHQLTNWNNSGNLKDNNCEALFPLGDGKLFACTELGVTLVDPSQKEPMVAHYSFKNNYSRAPELFGCFTVRGSPYWFYGSQGLFRLQNDTLIEDW
jgi:ligand-binding sensor domain-containing protein